MGRTGIELIEAVQAGRAALARKLRSHPSIEDLEEYHRGSLDTESRELILDHLAECQDCTILLLYGVIEPHGPGLKAILPKARLEEAWDRLRPRLSLIRQRDRTLASLLSEGPPLSPQRAIELAAAVARALARRHAQGQVISDLRPETIVIDSVGEVRVLDFGLAPSAGTLEAGYGRASEDALVDLYRFLSPEQVVREGLTPQSNLFSLGVLLYELLTGISPFRASTPLLTASRILSLDPVPVRELASEVDASLEELIDRMLAKEPEQRPGDAGWVARELDRMVEGTASQTAAGAPAATDLEAQIERLYDQVIHLSEDSAMDPSMRDQELESAFARLLELQYAEAEKFRESFEASLEMPIDAGEQILAQARRLREELEDLATKDTAPGSSDTP
jgi:serine/threonine protein kinase